MDRAQFVNWFRATSPYIHVHRGKTFVIQINDRLITHDHFNHFVHDLALLISLGIKPVLIFGARDTIESYLNDRHINSHYHKGVRITDADTMEHVKTTAGKLLVHIQARLSMGLGNTPMSNATIRVSSGNHVSARPLGVIDGRDYEFSGKIRRIDVAAIENKLANGEIVVLPPLGYSISGEAYNLSAATLAANVAIALRAQKLIYVMEEKHLAVFMDNKPVNQMNQMEAQRLISRVDEHSRSYRYLKYGMKACVNGVERVHLLNQEEDGALLNELFTRDGSGAMITTTAYDVIRKATTEDIGGILDLIQPLEQQGILIERSREKLELEVNRFTLLIRDGVIIGSVALYPYPEENIAEVVCLAIHADYHNHGHGKQLLGEIEKEAKDQGIERLFVLTTQTDHWFLEHGFTETSIDKLPVKKQRLYNYRRNAKALLKTV